MAEKRTVMIVGASRGLGLALAQEWCGRDWHVIATARGPSKGLDALAARYPGSVEIETVDINDISSVRALGARLGRRPLDILYVNAGIARAIEETAATVDEADFLDMMLTNALSPVRAVELLHNLVRPDGVIAIMTSELGSITDNVGFWTLYSSSKAALNMLMKGFASRHGNDPRALLLVAPGWVRTEMGGDSASLSIEESIPLVAAMVERNRGTPGLRFLDRHGDVIPW